MDLPTPLLHPNKKGISVTGCAVQCCGESIHFTTLHEVRLTTTPSYDLWI